MTSCTDQGVLAWQCPRCATELEEAAPGLVCAACGFHAPARDGIGFFAPDFIPPGFARDRRDHLAELEPRHFWFRGRAKLLAAFLHRFIPRGERSLELGCGSGFFLPQLAARFETTVGLDAYPESLAAAHERAPGAVLVQADVSHVPLGDHQFDLVAALDVLEHVPAHALLSEARRLLREGGLLLLTVPSSLSLMSAADEGMGHRTRYRLADLQRELHGAGLRLIHHTHYQFLLFGLMWAARRLPLASLRKAERHPPRIVSSTLGLINDAEVRWLQGRSLPWGSSLVAIATHDECITT